MNRNYTQITLSIFVLIVLSLVACGQSVDDPISINKMKKDLEVFKDIRRQANSGLYKYRTKAQIDSIYQWAETELAQCESYLDFYNIICQLTDYEGSAHNDTDLSNKHAKSLRKEDSGYFPYPIKWIDGSWLINYKDGELPLGSEIIRIDGMPIAEVISSLYKYYPTDGQNITGKRIGIRAHFSKYYRFAYGRQESFEVTYATGDSDTSITKTIESVGYSDYYYHFNRRHSRPYDNIYYRDLKGNQKYGYKKLSPSTGILTIHDFSMGNETSPAHKTFVAFLDSTFAQIKTEKLTNLILDVRINGGGDDPNDMVSYSYLSSRDFQESQEVWISFQKVPFLKYYDSPAPRFLRPLGVGKFNRMFRKRFPNEKDGKYYISSSESEMRVRAPHQNAFTGNIYLLISPAVASAGSLFAAMVTGNQNTTVIGAETMGGYYGHNGHTPMGYVLPKSKITTSFFIENIEQDVPPKANQVYNRGIIPDYDVPQTRADFMNNQDTQLKFVMELINKERK